MAELLSFSARQQSLLKALLHGRAGMSVDEIADHLEISRNATNQHLSSLAGLELIDSELRPSSGGRPVRGYFLSARGLELFPRRYAHFSKSLIDWFRSIYGEQALLNCLSDLGEQIAEEYAPRTAVLNSLALKIGEVSLIMNELGYEAIAQTTDDAAVEAGQAKLTLDEVTGEIAIVARRGQEGPGGSPVVMHLEDAHGDLLAVSELHRPAPIGGTHHC